MSSVLFQNFCSTRQLDQKLWQFYKNWSWAGTFRKVWPRNARTPCNSSSATWGSHLWFSHLSPDIFFIYTCLLHPKVSLGRWRMGKKERQGWRHGGCRLSFPSLSNASNQLLWMRGLLTQAMGSLMDENARALHHIFSIHTSFEKEKLPKLRSSFREISSRKKMKF